MKKPSLIPSIIGVLTLLIASFNAISAEYITPSFVRAEVLSGFAGIVLILITIILTDIEPNKPSNKEFSDKQFLILSSSLDTTYKEELKWGSKLFLTATSAISILIYWKGTTLLKRGIVNEKNFVPGNICNQAIRNKKVISIVKTDLFPGKIEFDTIKENLPSVIIAPIDNTGVIILGGANERCFTKSDEIWLVGWSERLNILLSEY